MSTKHFYSHLISFESLSIELSKMDLSEEQRVHLLSLIDSNVHHTILDLVLSELKDKDKELFLEHLTEKDHSSIWKFLNERVDRIEEKIKKTAEKVTVELHEDIKEQKK